MFHQVNSIVRWSAQFVVLGCLLSSFLFGGVAEDESAIQKITDLKSCLSTLKTILQENVRSADKNCDEQTSSAVNSVIASIEAWKANPKDLDCVAWDIYPKFTKAYALLHGVKAPSDEHFLQYGFRQGVIDEKLNTNFLNAFQYAKAIPFTCEDCDPNYLSYNMGINTEERLNNSHTYVMLDDLQRDALKPIILSLKDQITECLGMPWRVATLRAWKTAPKPEEFGPNAWHKDGMPLSVLKIMYYPRGASSEKGSVELQLPEVHAVEGEPGTWVLFKPSEIVHRALAPQVGERIAVEITILPSLTYALEPISAGQNARHPILPWQNPYASKHPLYKQGEVVGVNIGGGPKWHCGGWVNLEELASSANPNPFHLFPNCRFPIENGGTKNVYTSHAIEHLNTPTVYRVLSEAHRVLEEEGNLLIKIPDYDRALDCWRRQDSSFFGPVWNIESVTPLWSKKGVCDCLDHRAAMIFCSFFNDAYGNPFNPTRNSNPAQAYFGPPILSVGILRDLIKDRSPSQIAKELRKVIGLKENNYHYGHQSAWSREELKAVLNEFGFEIVSFDPNVITGSFGAIPGMREMKDVSTFCWARKKSI